MIANQPDDLHTLYGTLMARGDLDGLVELYENEATFNGGPTGQLHGRDAIRAHLGAFLDRDPIFKTRTRAVVVSGDIALLAADWHFIVTGADGDKIDRSGTSIEVARRQPDGRWRYVIDEPAFLDSPAERSARSPGRRGSG